MGTPGLEGGISFDQRFAECLSRRRCGMTPSYERPALQWRTSSSRSINALTSTEARDDLTLSFTDMKLEIPSEKLKQAGVKEETGTNNSE